jgi:putative endonuclease
LTGPTDLDENRLERHWQVYILRCADDSLYTGITTNVERRLAEHRAGGGAKYLRGRTPLRLVYLETGHDRSSASRREVEIKRLRPDAKRALIVSPGNRLAAVILQTGPLAGTCEIL